ncbi:hypothetical protein RRG08_033682 [Elysia crispata]|uniref:Uncharacterized protein n=1 Tax=Elysia crispata TaxID=231223 RepID=A0AAE1DUC6_9GAST|nr:hypothetical protein RRG08_033682 [Elysia crispata]
MMVDTLKAKHGPANRSCHPVRARPGFQDGERCSSPIILIHPADLGAETMTFNPKKTVRTTCRRSTGSATSSTQQAAIEGSLFTPLFRKSPLKA